MPPRRPGRADQEVYADVVFPRSGISLAVGFERQPQATTTTGTNVRAFEPATNRVRGGSRPGLSRWIDATLPPGGTLVQHLNYVVDPDGTATLDNLDYQNGVFLVNFIVDPTVEDSFGGRASGPLGEPTVRFVRMGGSGYQPRRKNKASVRILWDDPDSVPAETVLSGTQLNATAVDQRTNLPVDGAFVYNPPAGTPLNTVSSAYPLVVVFTPTSTNYRTAQRTVHIAVLIRDVSINWSDPAIIGMGQALSATQLNAQAIDVLSGLPLVGGSYVYTPPAGTSFDEVQFAVPLKVDFTPADSRHRTATKTVHIDVNKGLLVIRASNQSKQPGTLFTFDGTEFTSAGLQAGDSVSHANLASAGAALASAAGSYAITISNATGVNLDQYTISYQQGTMTVGSTCSGVVYLKTHFITVYYGAAAIFPVINSTVSNTQIMSNTSGNQSAGSSGPTTAGYPTPAQVILSMTAGAGTITATMAEGGPDVTVLGPLTPDPASGCYNVTGLAGQSGDRTISKWVPGDGAYTQSYRWVITQDPLPLSP